VVCPVLVVRARAIAEKVVLLDISRAYNKDVHNFPLRHLFGENFSSLLVLLPPRCVSPAIPLLKLFPPPRRLVVPRRGLRASRRQPLRGPRVSKAFRDSRDLHARRQQVRPMTVAKWVMADSLG